MTINERKLKIVGTANIPTDLTNGKNYDLVIKNAEVRGISEDPNDDGTVDKTHKLKLSELSEVAIVDGREIIKAKVKGSMAKAMRFKMQKLFEVDRLAEGMEFEVYYRIQMTRLMAFLDEWIEGIENGEDKNSFGRNQ
jgi:hypothetical protein